MAAAKKLAAAQVDPILTLLRDLNSAICLPHLVLIEPRRQPSIQVANAENKSH